MNAEDQIRAQCQAAITAGARRDNDSALAHICELTTGPNLKESGPTVAAVFSDSIQHGCTTVGALLNGLPHLALFEPDGQDTFSRLPNQIPEEVIRQARSIFGFIGHSVREFITARATGDLQRADLVYWKVSAADHLDNFLFQLWGIAIQVQRAVEVMAAYPACPACDQGAVDHLGIDRSIVYTCGHLKELNDLTRFPDFAASLQAKLYQAKAPFRRGPAQ